MKFTVDATYETKSIRSIVAAPDFEPGLNFFVNVLEFKIAMISPADNPNYAILTRDQFTVALDKNAKAQPLSIEIPVENQSLIGTGLTGPNGTKVINDAYNANPMSVEANLKMLAAIPAGDGRRRIALLGDMLELGDDAPELHASLVDEFVGNSIDLVFLCGTNMESLYDVLPGRIQGLHTMDSDGLLPHVLAQARSLEPRETRLQMRIRGCVCVCVQTYVSTSEHAFPRSFCLSWGRTTQR